MNDNYSAASGQGIYAGRFNLPAWLQAIQPNTWGQIAATGTIEAINPKNNPAINPNYPNNPEWWASNGLASVVTAWCGGYYNYQRKRFGIGMVAGHADYAGGEWYGIDLTSDAPAWVMDRLPSGAVGNELITNDGQELTGLYADGRPRAIHSYNKMNFVPDVGPVVVPQGSCSWSGQNGTLKPVLINPITLEMDLFGEALGTGAAGDYSGGGTCYDPSRNAVWVKNAGTGRFHRYNVSSNTWSLNQSVLIAQSGYVGLEYIPNHDCILMFSTHFANGFVVFDCVTGTITQPAVSGAYVGISKPSGEMQPRRYESNKFAFWNNSTDTAVINTLSFSSNPRTDTWQIGQLPVAPTNSVMPSAKVANGTYGRFFHDADYKCFGVYNGITQPVYIYRY